MIQILSAVNFDIGFDLVLFKYSKYCACPEKLFFFNLVWSSFSVCSICIVSLFIGNFHFNTIWVLFVFHERHKNGEAKQGQNFDLCVDLWAFFIKLNYSSKTTFSINRFLLFLMIEDWISTADFDIASETSLMGLAFAPSRFINVFFIWPSLTNFKQSVYVCTLG